MLKTDIKNISIYPGKKEHRDLVASLIEYYDASYKVPTGEALR